MREYERKGWFKVELPDGWEVDEGEEPLAIYHPEGAGALQVTVQAPRPLKPGERIDVFLLLRAFLKQTGVDVDLGEARRRSDRGLEWISCEYASASSGEGTLFWRVWMATNHDTVIYLTYICPEEEKEVEREVVDRIVSSLELR